MQDITEAVDFVGNTVALLGIHGKENYIFYCKFVPKYFFQLSGWFYMFLMAFTEVLKNMQFTR